MLGGLGVFDGFKLICCLRSKYQLLFTSLRQSFIIIFNKIYSLKIGFDEIIAQLEKQQRKAVDEVQGKIEMLLCYIQ